MFTITAPETDTTAVAVKAVYNNGVLDSVDFETVELKAGQTEVEIAADEGTKVMLWNNLTDMKPLADAQTAAKYNDEEPETPTIVPSGTVLLSEDFTGVSDTWGFTSATGVSIAGTDDKYLQLATKNGSATTDKKELDSSVVESAVLDVSFDWKTDVDLTSGSGRQSAFELWDSDGNIIFCIAGASNRPADFPVGVSYAIGERVSKTAASLKQIDSVNDWYTVKLELDFVNKTLSGTIDSQTGTVATIEKTQIASDNLAAFAATNFSSLAPMNIDNVEIKTGITYPATFKVTSGKDGQPVNGATIELSPYTATTNSMGEAVLALPSGTFSANVTAAAHMSKSVDVTVNDAETNVSVVLEYAGDPEVTRLEIKGGDGTVYKPNTGKTTTSVNPYTAVVYDQTDAVMSGEKVVWTVKDSPAGVSISQDGIVTVTDEIAIADYNGTDVVIVATSETDPSVYAEARLHINDTASLETFDIAGPSVIKDGMSGEYSVVNPKDQYGADYTGEAQYTLTTNNSYAAVDGMKVNANFGTAQTAEFKITVTSNNGKTSEKTVKAYGYDFYEPGVDQCSYGDARIANVADGNYIVWPATAVAAGSFTIVLPEAVELTPGSAKKISYSTAWTVKTIVSQDRELRILSDSGTLFRVEYKGAVTAYNNDGASVVFGEQGASSTFEEEIIVLSTDVEGKTTAVLSHANGETQRLELGTNIGSISKIELYGGKGAPDDRLLAIKDIIISDSDIAEVEIIGNDYISKVSGMEAARQFEGNIFSREENETFTWSVSDADGAPINGVTIDQSGLLKVQDSVATGTVVVVKYSSDINETKFAEKEVTVRDFASVKSFDIDGPAAVNAGDTAEYSAENIIDEYDDVVNMPVTFAVEAGSGFSGTPVSIDAETGVLVSAADSAGDVTVSVTVGNPGKTKTITKEVFVGKFSENGDVTSNETVVDVSKIANYSTDTKYLVTVLKSDGSYTQTETKSTDGKVTIDTTGASKYEVSPIYTYNDVFDARTNPKEIPLADGYYDVTVTKNNGERSDIFVNGDKIMNNLDQNGTGRASSGSTCTTYGVKVVGGSAVISSSGTKDERDDGGTVLKFVEVKQNPTIIPRKTHLFVLGDSLVSSYYGTFADDDGDGIPNAGTTQTGWGQVLDKFMSDDVIVTNLAESGNFAVGLLRNEMPSVLSQAESGDCLIFECGYNDANPKNGTKADMIQAMTEVYQSCEEKGITVIFVSPNAHAKGDGWKAGLKYSGDVISTAKDLGAESIDLAALSFAYLEPLGNEYCASNFNVTDLLHSTYLGAMKMAEIVAQSIYDQYNDGNEAFADLKVNTDAVYNLKDVNGDTITMQVK